MALVRCWVSGQPSERGEPLRAWSPFCSSKVGEVKWQGNDVEESQAGSGGRIQVSVCEPGLPIQEPNTERCARECQKLFSLPKWLLQQDKISTIAHLPTQLPNRFSSPKEH
jgi:hypothetical protein